MSVQIIYPPAVPHMLGFEIVKGFTGYAVSYDCVRSYVWTCWARKACSSFIGSEWKELKTQKDAYGYDNVNLFGGKRKSKTVHSLIATAFIGPRPDGQEVRHGCAGRNCNLPSNLCYGTRAENNSDRWRDGTMLKGEDVKNSRLNEAAVHRIHGEYRSGSNQYEIAKKYGVSQSVISEILSGKKWAWMGITSAKRYNKAKT